MPSATFQKSNNFKLALGTKLHQLDTDTLKFALTNTAPVATTVSFNAGAGQAHEAPTNTGGYTAGGATADIAYTETPAGTGTLALNTLVQWTGSGAGIGPFRYAILYNDTAAADNVIGWFDYGSPGVTLVGVGETMTINTGTICTVT